MNMFASGHEKQTIKVGLCVFLCVVCVWWGWLWPSGEGKFWEFWGWARWRKWPDPWSLCSVYLHPGLTFSRNAGSWPAELIAGWLPAASTTTPPRLAPGLAMRSLTKDVSKRSQMGLPANISEFGTTVDLTSSFPVPRLSLEKFQE